jgi:SAM-dependent methyltransferase
MSVTSEVLEIEQQAGLASASDTVSAVGLGRCIDCGALLKGSETCPGCGRRYPVVDGILHAINPLTGTNRIAGKFYDGPSWTRFRPWEQLFLWCNGPGPVRARQQILRHLPRVDRARVLEVGIGGGPNVPLLPPGWDVYGVDIACSLLASCLDRNPRLAGHLAWAEAEALPFEDASFDVVYTIGGFNYFRDPASALREMSRVARPGATRIVADEEPDLIRFSPGRALGLDVIDRWGLRAMGLDVEFVAMAQNYQIDVASVVRSAWTGYRRFPIWNRLGYCLVSPDPTPGH